MFVAFNSIPREVVTWNTVIAACPEHRVLSLLEEMIGSQIRVVPWASIGSVDVFFSWDRQTWWFRLVTFQLPAIRFLSFIDRFSWFSGWFSVQPPSWSLLSGGLRVFFGSLPAI